MGTNVPLANSPVQRKLFRINKGSKLNDYTLTSSDIQITATPKWHCHLPTDCDWTIPYDW